MAASLPAVCTISVLGLSAAAMHRIIRAQKVHILAAVPNFRVKLILDGSAIVLVGMLADLPPDQLPEMVDRIKAQVRNKLRLLFFVVRTYKRIVFCGIGKVVRVCAKQNRPCDLEGDNWPEEMLLESVSVVIETGNDAFLKTIELLSGH